ncbi:MAG: hypothetical protein AABY15_00060 [Nanoarchaeota archaeon]
MMSKVHANRGVERNKKPLQNIVYKIEVSKNPDNLSEEEKKNYEKYRFKEEGYLVLLWKLQKEFNKDGGRSMNWHGFITPDDLKERLGQKQWAKFCSGKREFIIQRRADGKNVKKVKK